MIDVIGAVVILLLIVVSYLGGMATANYYNEKARREEKYLLEVQYARLRAGVDFYDPAGPYVYKGNGRAGGPPIIRNPSLDDSVARREGSKSAFDLSQMHSFEERLKNTGSATVLLKKNPTSEK
jgi:hypothetical protein